MAIDPQGKSADSPFPPCMSFLPCSSWNRYGSDAIPRRGRREPAGAGLRDRRRVHERVRSGMGGPRRRPLGGRVCRARDARRRVGPRSRRYHRDRRRVPDVLVERVDDRRGRRRRSGVRRLRRAGPRSVGRRRGAVVHGRPPPDQRLSHRVRLRSGDAAPTRDPAAERQGIYRRQAKTPSGCSIFKRSSGEGSPAQIRRPAIRPAPSAAAVAGSSGRRPRRRGRVRPRAASRTPR